jgi:predicted nucleic acid-binding protein
MICVDASVIIAWQSEADDPKAADLDALLRADAAAIAPVTITELLSGAKRESGLDDAIKVFHVLDLTPGYWERAGALRAALRRAGRKAPMADALIAQACIDAKVSLLTNDADFKIHAELFGLSLA